MYWSLQSQLDIHLERRRRQLAVMSEERLRVVDHGHGPIGKEVSDLERLSSDIEGFGREKNDPGSVKHLNGWHGMPCEAVRAQFESCRYCTALAQRHRRGRLPSDLDLHKKAVTLRCLRKPLRSPQALVKVQKCGPTLLDTSKYLGDNQTHL